MPYKTKAAVLFESPGKWEITTLNVDDPKEGEVLVQMAVAGLCHSMDHLITGDAPPTVMPVVGGDEGGGIVKAVGPGVTELEVGDHVVTSFVPACGTCRWCATGMQHLCDNGAQIFAGAMLDGTRRLHLDDGTDVSAVAGIGPFSELQVMSTLSAVKVPKDLPLASLVMLACCVPTGWGSSTNAAEIRSGDVVIVMGTGGIGINAVQGAAHKGAYVVAVDPVEFKRETSLKLGARKAFPHISEAQEFVNSITNGQGADAAVVTTGVRTGAHVGEAFSAIRKGGTVVVTGLGDYREQSIPVDMFELSMFQKRIQGCLYGNGSPRDQIPQLTNLYRTGDLKLDELITTRYSLEQINDGYRDLLNGKNIRGVIDFGIL